MAGRWIYLHLAVDQHGQVIDVLVSTRRDKTAARALFTRGTVARTDFAAAVAFAAGTLTSITINAAPNGQRRRPRRAD